MKNWYSRTVFFVQDAEKSIAFYRDKLGCSLAWNYQEAGRAVVWQRVGRVLGNAGDRD
jgi:catechol 2,3-dioxygenase-like lactoylglutathione lyase family enzyme